jgi:predicted HTH domain antitoxin
MEYIQRVSDIELAQQTQKILNDVQRGYMAVVERQGEPDVAMIDMIDYGIMRAALRYFIERPAVERNPGLAESTLDESNIQERFDLVLSHYLAGVISLGRAAELLNLPIIALRNRFSRLHVPLYSGSIDMDDVHAEVQAALAWKPNQL